MPKLGGMHTHCHEEAADQKHGSVEATQVPFQINAALAKCIAPAQAVNTISHEHRSEEQNLGGQKCPHPERGNFTLLVGVLELMCHQAMLCHDRLPSLQTP